MGFINVLVGSKCVFSLKNKQLFIKKDNGEQIDYPIEDINSLIIENQQSVISLQSINALIDNNVIIYLCDNKHLPSTYILGYNSFYKNLEVYNYQIECPKPNQKQIWKNIIQQKILNQTKVLQLLNIDNDLGNYIKAVKSGDIDNIESIVASKYFKLLFGKNFSRKNDNLINSALNYGYAIIRGAVARTVVAHGMQPYLGIHHCNRLNNFNLVDDLIEPFRPIVDLYVFKNLINQDEKDLSTNTKIGLHSLLLYDVEINNCVYDVSTAIDIFVNSFVGNIKNKNNKLKNVNILNLKVHSYE